LGITDKERQQSVTIEAPYAAGVSFDDADGSLGVAAEHSYPRLSGHVVSHVGAWAEIDEEGRRVKRPGGVSRACVSRLPEPRCPVVDPGGFIRCGEMAIDHSGEIGSCRHGQLIEDSSVVDTPHIE
jgi:hypothetical protein